MPTAGECNEESRQPRNRITAPVLRTPTEATPVVQALESFWKSFWKPCLLTPLEKVMNFRASQIE